MARHKNSTALFDVIHSAKKPPKESPSASIPTPKWWGKGRSVPKPPVPVPVQASTENAGRQKSWLIKAKQNGVAPLATPSTVEPVVQDQPSVAYPIAYTEPVADDLPRVESVATELSSAVSDQPAEPKPRFIDRFVNRDPKPAANVAEDPAVLHPSETLEESIVSELKPQKRISRSRDERDPALRVDSAAGDIQFRLSYGGVVAIGFVFVLLLAIAFVAGRQSSTQTAFDDGSASPKESTTAPTSGMLVAVGPTTPSKPINADPVKPDVLIVPQHPARPVVVIDPKKSAPSPLPIKNTRDIGLIYVIVQSYAEQDLAQSACDYMNNAGVPCTLVQGPSNWAPRDWYSVISLKSFNKHDPELAGYERAVKALGVKFTSRVIDQFQPQAYTWREDSDLSQQ